MPYNPVAEQVFGTIGTVCWTAQLLPQIWKSWREKSTEGLSHSLVLMWGVGSIFQGVYAILQHLNIPLMLQPQLFGLFSLLSWGQCLYYGSGRSRTVASMITVSVMIICGVLEAVMIIVIRRVTGHPRDVATNFFGIFASIIIAVALFPQYWEIYKHKEVVGVSLIFIGVDMLGGVFNDLSLVFRAGEVDTIALVFYTLVIVLDGVIIVAACILNPMARRRRRRMAERENTMSTVTSFDSPNKCDSGAGTPMILLGTTTPVPPEQTYEMSPSPSSMAVGEGELAHRLFDEESKTTRAAEAEVLVHRKS